MDIFQPIVAARITYVLGIVNLVTGALILLSCRCVPGLRIVGNLMRYKAYQRFFKYHCYIWWVFWSSVVVHAIFAVTRFGRPF